MSQIDTKRHPLATPVQYVKGVGPVLASMLERMGIRTASDLLAVTPIRYLDRRKIYKIAELKPGKDVTVVGKIVASGAALMGHRRKKIFELIVGDEGHEISVKFFHFNQRFFQQKFKVGAKVVVSGEVTVFIDGLQFLHPEIEIISDEDDFELKGRIVPIYPLTEGLHQKTMRKIIGNAWDLFNKDIHPIFPAYFAERYKLSDPWSCLQEIHFPSPDLDPDILSAGKSVAHRTLVFDELFFMELGLALRKKRMVSRLGIPFAGAKDVNDNFISSLPFTLTQSQKRVLGEIFSDMERPQPMNRLLQGDVGSGKTVVALIAAIKAISCGYQAAIMAPTEILAEQHAATIGRMLEGSNITSVLLTSSVKGKERAQVTADISSGISSLVIGTHALIQEGISFAKLGFICVDEQHRFGVAQRAAIRDKGIQTSDGKALFPDILIMTATPIPRTLSMTLYGDLDVSVIDELPRGRVPIVTRLYGESQRDKLYDGILSELKRGRQAYVVYPLIEESEKVDLKNATDMSKELAAKFEPEFRVALLHGRMKSDEKEKIMADFKSGAVHILAATSVVEVGVDVPNASVMIIEQAERFGLSQLHQLRGRVGRSVHQSYCVLMADYKRSAEARERLQIMVDTTDGFKIAEKDLEIRGPGEFIGTKQSGLPPFRIANIARDIGILSEAREAAFKLVDDDPGLTLPQHGRMKDVLLMRWEGKLGLADIS